MIQKNPYAAYNNSKIQTATPAELTLLLYDGAIKFANIAAVAIEKGDIERHTIIFERPKILYGSFKRHWITSMRLLKILMQYIHICYRDC